MKLSSVFALLAVFGLAICCLFAAPQAEATHPQFVVQHVQAVQVQPVYAAPVVQPVCHVQAIQQAVYAQPVIQQYVQPVVQHVQRVQVQRVIQVQHVHHVAPVIQRVRVVERRRGPFLSLQIGR